MKDEKLFCNTEDCLLVGAYWNGCWNSSGEFLQERLYITPQNEYMLVTYKGLQQITDTRLISDSKVKSWMQTRCQMNINKKLIEKDEAMLETTFFEENANGICTAGIWCKGISVEELIEYKNGMSDGSCLFADGKQHEGGWLSFSTEEGTLGRLLPKLSEHYPNATFIGLGELDGVHMYENGKHKNLEVGMLLREFDLKRKYSTEVKNGIFPTDYFGEEYLYTCYDIYASGNGEVYGFEDIMLSGDDTDSMLERSTFQ